VIREVSEALVDLIEQASPDLGSWVELHSLSAADAGPTALSKGVLALLAAGPHPYLVNRPLVERPEGLSRAPLYLRLQYLFTAFGDHDEAMTRLTRAAQAFHTTPVLDATMLQPPLASAVESVAIRMLSPSPDERNQVWGALGRPGRPALFYEVDVAPVEPAPREGAGRVREHRVRWLAAR
jgi:hypothetical protein